MTKFAKFTRLFDILVLFAVLVLSLSGVIAGILEIAAKFGIDLPQFTGREVVIQLAQPFFYCPQLLLLIYFNFSFSPIYIALAVSVFIFVGSFLAFIFSFKRHCGRIAYIIKATFRIVWVIVALSGVYICQIASYKEGFVISLTLSLMLLFLSLCNLALAFQPGDFPVKQTGEKVPVIVQVVGNKTNSSGDATTSAEN